MSEFELKFGVDPSRAAAIDAALRRLPSRRVTIVSRYFDSLDHRLADAGLSLRLRRAGRAWEQTLKAPAERLAERLEETVPRPGRWGPDGPPVDPELHDGTAAGKALRAVLGGPEASARLEPVHTCTVVRRFVEIEALGARVEVAFDRGEIRADTGAAAVCEVEYELKDGDTRALVELGRTGVQQQGLWLSTVSKAMRGDRLARGLALERAVKAGPPRLRRGMTGPEIFRAVLKACLDQVLANASEVAEGHRDDESVHQLRIGLRRTRTACRELAVLQQGSDTAWLAPLAEAFRTLGAYRDRSVVAAALQSRLAASGSPEPTLRSSQGMPADPVDVVRASGFQCALLDGLALTLAEADAGPGAGRDALDRIASRLDQLERQLKRAAKDFERSSPQSQHRARKRLKRLRYLAELVGSLYKPAQVERYIDRLSPAQDALGAHIDLLVGLDMARESALAGDAEAWFNVGWLTAQLAPSARRCRKALARSARAEPFWKR
jgi:triphosphatase